MDVPRHALSHTDRQTDGVLNWCKRTLKVCFVLRFDGAGSRSTAHRSAVSGPPILQAFRLLWWTMLSKISFWESPIFGHGCFMQHPNVMLQKVLDFKNHLVKTSHCALNAMIYNSLKWCLYLCVRFGGHSKRNSQNTFRVRKVLQWPWLRGHRR